MAELENKLLQLQGICIYRNLLKDTLVQIFLDLLEALAGNAGPEMLMGKYAEYLSGLIEKTELGTGDIVGDPWRNYILELILEDENTFTRKAEYVSFDEMSQGMLGLVKQDLRTLQAALYLSLEDISALVDAGVQQRGVEVLPPRICGSFQSLTEGQPSAPVSRRLQTQGSIDPPGSRRQGFQDLEPKNQKRCHIKQFLAESSDWGECLAALAAFFRYNGAGMFGTYRAFRWVPGKQLVGILHPDPIKLDDLIGYERERGKVVDNTRRFVQGHPANNVLLYGDRGTGKSSTVKGLLHEFGDQGLRLVEVSREAFKEFPEIMALLSQRPQRFIIFIDDLSFEEYETEYKSLKGLLEGGLQAQPENVLIYATSNRKHLIKETFEDRTGPRAQGDLHPGDAQEEKISLADRFGLVVTFLRPDQKTYLEIVKGLAEKEGIPLKSEELETLALRWEMLHNGRSGRTAKQFIQDLLGRINTGEEM